MSPMCSRLRPLADTIPLACLALSVVTLGHALQIANGFYDSTALRWLTVAFALCAAGVLSSTRRPQGSFGADLTLRLIIIAAIGWQVIALLTAPPGMYLDPRENLDLFKAGVIVEAAIIAAGAAGLKKLDRLWFPALLVVHLLLGRWILTASPTPHIDVVVVHRAAIDALLQGHNPYAITFQDIYGADSGFYNPAAVAGGRVMFGYPYPPLSLLLAVPGQLLAGDYRYSELAAVILSAGLIGNLRPTMTARLAAALFLTQPRGMFVLEQGWTEPIAVLMVALALFTMIRFPRLAGWTGGLAVVTKQYLMLAGPLLLRFGASLSGGGTLAFGRRGALAGTLVTLPFALWHVPSFIDSVVLLQTREPFRIDSLSYLSWAAREGWGTGSIVWAIAAACIALVVSAWRTPNTPAGFAASLALSSFAMFAFGSKAFCNYYFFVVGTLCGSIAARSATPVLTPPSWYDDDWRR